MQQGLLHNFLKSCFPRAPKHDVPFGKIAVAVALTSSFSSSSSGMVYTGPDRWCLRNFSNNCSDYSRSLLTPLASATTPAEKHYNLAHSSTRMVIERLNGILKRRFPCLSLKLRFSPAKYSAVIVACAGLHNLSLILNNSIDPEDEEFEEMEVDDHDNDNESKSPMLPPDAILIVWRSSLGIDVLLINVELRIE
uniref:DDE Tnp4 domain-containing protein n=1 Tax=Romanomermis culicivorax TaxID=13658 RepID=A0A915HRT2_ROMCU